MKFSNRLLLSTTFLITACATTSKPKMVANSATLKSASGTIISVVERQPNLFHLQHSNELFAANVLAGSVTSGYGSFARGLVNHSYNDITADRLVKQSGVIDPARYMETSLKNYLSSQTSLALGVDLDYSASGQVKPNKLPLGKSDYILDVTTLKWGLNYFPLNWGSYQTSYLGNIKLLDGNTGEIVAQNTCNYKHPRKAKTAPSYKKLTENNAALLKANLKLLAEVCMDEFKAKALGF